MTKNVFYWALYDFANSIVMIVFLFYFSQWIVVDSAKPDWWYNGALIAASLLFIITAPVIGQRIDETKRKINGLRFTTAVAFLLHFLTACITLFAPEQVLLAVVLFALALYFYLLSFVYYTPMLSDLSDGANLGAISGIGQGANYVGQVSGLLLTLPFAMGALYLFGEPGRAQTLLPATVLFGLLVLPMMLWYRETPHPGEVAHRSIREEYGMVRERFAGIARSKYLLYFFIAYFLFGDALLTFANNFPIFLEKVFGSTDDIKTYLTAGILLIAGVGAIVFGKVADKKGSISTLRAILIAWCVLFPALAFAPSFSVAAGICLIAGTIFAATFGISRVLVTELAPKGTIATSFSYYIVAERFSTFVGPIVWSAVVAGTAGSGAASYSYAIFSMGLIVLASLFFIGKIPNLVVTRNERVS